MNRKIVSIAVTIAAVGLITILNPVATAASEPPKGWFKAGSHPQGYEMTVDTSVKHGGKAAARIESATATPADGFGTLMQTIKAESYCGKRVRMSAWMKTESANSAQFWLRLDGIKRTLGFDNMDNRAVKGTTGWTKYEITLDVPETTVNIAFGFFVVGKGKAWADDFLFEVVGKEVPSTNMLSTKDMEEEQPTNNSSREYPKQPVNLNFEN